MGVRACPWPWSATTRGQSGALSGPEGGAQPESGDPAPGLGLWHSRSHRSPAECPQVSRVEEQLEPENRVSWTPAGPCRTHRSGPDPWKPERAARAPRLAAWPLGLAAMRAFGWVPGSLSVPPTAWAWGEATSVTKLFRPAVQGPEQGGGAWEEGRGMGRGTSATKSAPCTQGRGPRRRSSQRT